MKNRHLYDDDIRLHTLMLEHQRQCGETARLGFLADQMGVVPSALSRRLARLEKAGWIVRQRPPQRTAWRAVELPNQTEVE